MKKFARLYKTKEVGQILITIDHDDVGTEDEAVLVEFMHPVSGEMCQIQVVDDARENPGFSATVLKEMTKIRAVNHAVEAVRKCDSARQIDAYIQALERDQ